MNIYTKTNPEEHINSYYRRAYISSVRRRLVQRLKWFATGTITTVITAFILYLILIVSELFCKLHTYNGFKAVSNFAGALSLMYIVFQLITLVGKFIYVRMYYMRKEKLKYEKCKKAHKRSA